MKQRITKYTFNQSASQITLTDFESIKVSEVSYIKNLTTNQVIYSIIDTSTNTITVSGNVITFTFSNSGMANTDNLLIQIDNETFKTQGKRIAYAPQYHAPEDNEVVTQAYDDDNYASGRSLVLTDEGSYRSNFSGSSLAITIPNCKFTNGSKVVTTTTDLNAYDIHRGDYVKLGTDNDSFYAQVDKLVSANEILLVTNYAGASGGNDNASCVVVKPVIGSGASLNISASTAILGLGTNAGSISELERDVDILPLIKQCGISVSQRIINQDIYIGFYDETHPNTPYYYAWFRLTGTNAQQVICETAFSRSAAPTGGEIESTTITLPTGTNTSQILRYRVEALGDRVRFFVNNFLVAEHLRSLPRFQDLLTSTIRGINGGVAPASNTNITIDYDTTFNFNKLQVGFASDNEQITINNAPVVSLVSSVGANNTDFFSGDVSDYKYALVQVSSVGGGGTISFQGSNQPDFSGTLIALQALPAQGGTIVTSTTAVGHWLIPLTTRNFRVRTTAYTSGTLTANIQLFKQPLPYNFVAGAVTATISGTVTTSFSANQVVTPVPQTGQGSSTAHVRLSTADTNLVSVKNGAGVINTMILSNLSASFKFFKLYNKASAPVIGTDAALVTKVIPIPPNTTLAITGGTFGDRQSTGIAYAITNAVALADTTAVGASEVTVSIQYT